ncbi:kinase-like domain-containing protein [Whalleya microplaca]|nr:kinase-like domain-containing protein [Whalleya microplaca]
MPDAIRKRKLKNGKRYDDETNPDPEVHDDHHIYYVSPTDDLDVEYRHRYRPGGFHPIHLGDFIGGNDRFELVHKLGHGRDSTIWLCIDGNEDVWKAIKIMAADVSTEDCPDLMVLKAVAGCTREELDDNHIALPLEYFWTQGPNGRHLCFVSDVLGAHGCIPPPGTGQHTAEILTDLSYQVAKGVRFLHSKGICHGEIQPKNLAMKLSINSVDQCSRDDMEWYIDMPYCESLETIDGGDPTPCGPEYVVVRPNLRQLEKRFHTGKVYITGFGLSHRASAPPVTSRKYWKESAAPELLFTPGFKGKSGFPSDIWGLACTIFEISTGEPMIDDFAHLEVPLGVSFSGVITRMEEWLGPLPQKYRQVGERMIQNAREAINNDVYSGSQDIFRDDAKETSKTRSGKSYKDGAPMSPKGDADNYQRELRKFQKETGWSNRLQEYLATEKQYPEYYQNTDRQAYLDSSERDNTDSVSDCSGLSDIPKGIPGTTQSPFIQILKLHDTGDASIATQRHTSLIAGNDGGNSSESAAYATSKIPKRLKQYRPGEYPDPKRPCIHYPIPDISNVPLEWEGCEAEKHWLGPPERVCIFQMPKAEVLLLSDLLLSMLKYMPKDRITAEQVLQHEWFSESREREIKEDHALAT